MPSPRTMLTVLSALALAGCVRGPKLVEPQSRPGFVGPVEVAQLARLLVDGSSDGRILGKKPPFLVAVSPATKPKKPHLLRCAWKEGRLRNYAYLPAGPRNPDGTPDPEVDWVRLLPDFDRVEQVFHFSEDFVASPGLVDDIAPRERQATYHVAYLCSQGARVALLVGYLPGSLQGSGGTLILEKDGARWRVVEATTSWET